MSCGHHDDHEARLATEFWAFNVARLAKEF